MILFLKSTQRKHFAGKIKKVARVFSEVEAGFNMLRILDLLLSGPMHQQKENL
jgi:hypothetical protein